MLIIYLGFSIMVISLFITIIYPKAEFLIIITFLIGLLLAAIGLIFQSEKLVHETTKWWKENQSKVFVHTLIKSNPWLIDTTSMKQFFKYLGISLFIFTFLLLVVLLNRCQ